MMQRSLHAVLSRSLSQLLSQILQNTRVKRWHPVSYVPQHQPTGNESVTESQPPLSKAQHAIQRCASQHTRQDLH